MLFSLPLLVASAVATAQTYDVRKYCESVSQAVGGSYVIEKACQDQENQAKAAIAARSIEGRVRQHCDEVGTVIGGSYQIFKSCVDQEEAAKRSLGR